MPTINSLGKGPFVEIMVDKKEFMALTRWLGKFEETAKNPEVMDKGIKFLGQAIDRNFQQEGTPSMGGGWRPLSKMTQEVRASRGYNPKHPILQQSGELRDVTAGTLKSWTIGTSRVATGSRAARMVASTRPLQFHAKVSGAKVENQYGGQTEYTFYPELPGQGGSRSDLPARPFFGLTQAGVIQARDAIIDKIMSDWARKSGTAKRVR